MASVPFSRAQARCSTGLLAGAAELDFHGFGKNVENVCISCLKRRARPFINVSRGPSSKKSRTSVLGALSSDKEV